MKCPSNLLSPVLALLAACLTPAAAMCADDPQATNPVEKAASPTIPPMVVHNPDGTFTVQKAPRKNAKVTNAKKGLVIPPQVVVPIVPAREKSK
jgi:hypothetical protein